MFPGGDALEPLLSKPRTPPSVWKNCFWLGLSTMWPHDPGIGPLCGLLSSSGTWLEQADPGDSVQPALPIPQCRLARLSPPHPPAHPPKPGAHPPRPWGPWLDSLSWP